MLKINGTNIEISRGDEVDLFFSFSSDPPADGTVVRFTVKTRDGAVVIEKSAAYEDEQIHIHLSSSETDLPDLMYSYGLYVQYGDGSGYSPLARCGFIVNPSEAYQGTVMA